LSDKRFIDPKYGVHMFTTDHARVMVMERGTYPRKLEGRPNNRTRVFVLNEIKPCCILREPGIHESIEAWKSLGAEGQRLAAEKLIYSLRADHLRFSVRSAKRPWTLARVGDLSKGILVRLCELPGEIWRIATSK
jgi:hypothetical protein